MAPPVPSDIADAMSRYCEDVRARLLRIRRMIFLIAAETEGVGTLTETLKWCEPAHLTEESGSGTTIRLATVRSAPDQAAVLFNCKTTLVKTFREHSPEAFGFEGNRALLISATEPLAEEPLGSCLRAALIYHRR